MKPGFIILAIIGVVIVWATLQTSFSRLTDPSDRSSSTPPFSVPRVERNETERGEDSQYTSRVETFGRALSPYADMVTMRTNRAWRDDPKEEYIELEADRDNTIHIPITGWQIQSIAHNRSATIGTVTRIPSYSGNNIGNQSVVLEPDHRAYIISGSSPVRASFRTNKCTGYFAQNNTFEPPLYDDCPRPEDEKLEAFGIDSDPPERSNNRDYQCIRELERISTCENPGKPYEELSRDCREYIDQLGYDLCAGLHLQDPDFFGTEWYIYIGRGSVDLWDDDYEVLLLLDEQGRVVDSDEY